MMFLRDFTTCLTREKSIYFTPGKHVPNQHDLHKYSLKGTQSTIRLSPCPYMSVYVGVGEKCRRYSETSADAYTFYIK